MARPMPLVEPVTRATLPLRHGEFSVICAAQHGTGGRRAVPKRVIRPQFSAKMSGQIARYDSSAMDTKPDTSPPAIVTRRFRGPTVAAASPWCCRAAARWAPIRRGVYQALHEAGLEPDWVSGVSIGAINAALIAGNRAGAAAGSAVRILGPHHRPHLWPYTPDGDIFRQARNALSCADHRCSGPARLLQAAQGQSLVPAAGRQGRHQLLRQHAAARDPGRAGRFRSAQRRRRAFLGRRGECADRQFRLLRQSQGRDHAASM